MATIKFSGFSAGGTGDAGTTQLVGYKVGDATANYRYSISDLATMLSPSMDNFYTADGTIGTTRIAKVTDTVTFQNVGGTSSLFSLNTNGVFTLGKGAVAGGGYTAVAIGSAASCGNNYSVSVGANSNTTFTYSVALGGGSVGVTAQSGVAIGGNGTSVSGGYGIAIGYRANTSGGYSINLGSDSRGTGSTSITLNSSGGIAAPSTVNAFGVYMTSNTTPDFEVVGGGESTLNTNLKITGQGYTELYDTANTTLTVDWDNSNIQEITSLTGAHVFTASNPKIGATYILTLGQTGAVTPTWTGIKWPAATAPTLSGAGKTDIITLVCYDATGAGLYYGSSTLNFTT